MALEIENQERERSLGERWLKEEEERKRKAEEEEENKFDFSSFLLESKKQSAQRKGIKPGVKRGAAGSTSNTAKNGGLASRQLKSQTSGVPDASTTKRKTGMTKR